MQVSPGRCAGRSRAARRDVSPRTLSRLQLSLISLALIGCCAHLRASAQAAPELYLEVSVNGEATGRLMAVRQGPRGLRASRADLRQFGLARGALAAAPGVADADAGLDADLDLAAIDGLSYRYDAAAQALELRAADSLRVPFAINARRGAAPAAGGAAASASIGALLNYDLVAQGGRQRAALGALEARVFGPAGVFSTGGVVSIASGAGAGLGLQAVRHDSFFTTSDAATLRSWRLGDTITSSLPWNRALRIGGLQWSKSFSLRPDLATFPMPSIGGSAAVPSALSLYINGVQQMSTQIPGGPFVLQQVGGVHGAGEAMVVTRDALGRASATSLPLYVDARMLAAGLADYSLEIGVPRAGFGVRSFDYQGPLVASGSWRYGASDLVTIEAHGEAAPRFFNGGAGALLALGRFGVANVNGAVSSGQARGAAAGGSGYQGGVGYQYLAARVSIDVQLARAGRRYADLAARDGSSTAAASGRAALAWAAGAGVSLNASVVRYRNSARPLFAGAGASPGTSTSVGMPSADSRPGATTLVAVGAARAFAGGVYASVSAYRSGQRLDRAGLLVSLSMALGRVAIAASSGVQGGAAQRSVGVVQDSDLAGGAGWALRDIRQDGLRLQAARWHYLGERGQLGVTVQGGSQPSVLAFDASGAVVLMDGHASAARRVGAGFALVSTDGVADVPVLHENRLVGRTGAGGYLLVPDLNANAANLLAIDTTNLAADQRVGTLHQSVRPASLAGLLVRFPIDTWQAANVVLVDGAGAPLPVGLPVLHRESGQRTLVGFDGLAFIDDLRPANQLDIELGAERGRCSVRFAGVAAPGGDGAMPTIGPLRCVAAGRP